jgi:hypothetical protein
MKNDKIEELLNKEAISPTPELTPDLFLPTRIESIIDGKRQINPGKVLISNWSFASVITTCAIIVGIYVGSGILDTDNLQSSDDIFTEYSQAFYQSGFEKNWDDTLESGGLD